MELKLLFTLVCDDARIEQSNKVIVVGMYKRSINFQVPESPGGRPGNVEVTQKFGIPQLCFVRRWYVDSPGQRVRTELVDPGGGIQEIGTREIPFPVEDNLYQEIIRLGGPVLTVGVYKLRAVCLDRESKTFEEEFEVKVK